MFGFRNRDGASCFVNVALGFVQWTDVDFNVKPNAAGQERVEEQRLRVAVQCCLTKLKDPGTMTTFDPVLSDLKLRLCENGYGRGRQACALDVVDRFLKLGTFKSQLRITSSIACHCEINHALSQNLDICNVLMLSLSATDTTPVSLESLIKVYVAPEIVEYTCASTQTKAGAQQTAKQLNATGNQLIVGLKRGGWQHDGPSKNDTSVALPQKMALTTFNGELSAVVVHQGTNGDGHYVLYFRNHDQWWCRNDSILTRVLFPNVDDLWCCALYDRVSPTPHESTQLLKPAAASAWPRRPPGGVSAPRGSTAEPLRCTTDKELAPEPIKAKEVLLQRLFNVILRER